MFPPQLRPWITSASTGLLLILAFPKFGLAFFGWIALVPMLFAIEQIVAVRVTAGSQPVRRSPGGLCAFGYGYVAGFIFFAGTHYWIRIVMLNYGGLSGFEATGVWLGYVALMALYFGLFGTFSWLLLRLPDKLALWALPAAWVAIEFLRSYILTGLPFLLLGYVVVDHLLLSQLARFGGVYLLSFVLALFNTGILLLIRHSTRPRGMILAGAFFVLAFLSVGSSFLPTPSAPQTAYLAQTNARVDENWTPDATNRLMTEMDRLVLASYARNQSQSGLIVFPETPAALYQEDPVLNTRVANLARQTQSELLVNVIAFADPQQRKKPLNSAILVSPSGEVRGRYDKIHLVPFGEYVPYKWVFGFAGKLTAEVGDFVPGERAVPLNGEHSIGALICYEGIFPDQVRQFTAAGAQVLVNMSNDAWYGESAAREQLLMMARLRAVENGRWLLRATNTGITAVVDPYGRLITFPVSQRGVYPARFGYLTGITPYVAFGHWFPLACGAVVVLLLIITARKQRVLGPQPV